MKKDSLEETPIATLVIRQQRKSIKRLYIFLILYFVISSLILAWSIYDSVNIRNKMNKLLEEIKIVEHNTDDK